MKQFFNLVFFGLFFSLFVMVALEFLFTQTYSSENHRTKFQYFRSLKNQKVNFLFLGSSRVENDIIPELIQEKTGKRTVNMGFQAAKLSDIYTLLKLVKQYNIQTDTIFIQIDYIFNLENDYSNVLPYQIMPFIKENNVTKEYFKRHYISNSALYYVPFYRYAYFENKIGFRELFSNLIGKQTNVEKDLGFNGLDGVDAYSTDALPKKLKPTNKYYSRIVEFAKMNKLKIVLFCAPFNLETKNLIYSDRLQEQIPLLHDYSRVITDKSMFKNNFHLNKKGAKYFTQYLIDNLLN